ncbi:MAG: S-layer family protein [Cyanobacteria bacterium P01_A01_bin.40]
MKPYHHLDRFNLKFANISSAIALLTSLILVFVNYDRVQAQIIPDDSLGSEASTVTPDVEIKGSSADRIDGGAIRDNNLFHSFEQFNIEDLQRVYFANPAEITNIFSRVTGSNLSEILGTLGVNGDANLFFINPNGIIFGENASLDIGGSFLGSTADAIQFGDRGLFSATDPDSPPLLTIEPSALFFNQITPSSIVHRSVAPAGEDLTGDPLFGLRVPSGKSLILAGGEITVDGGGIQALGGQVELAAIADSAPADLNISGNNLSLSVPQEVTRGNITIQNGVLIDVTADDGGSIAIKARNLEIVDSLITAGIDVGLGTVDSQAGDIVLDTTEAIKIGASNIRNWVNSGATGKGGDVLITANSLKVEDFTFLHADTLGQGNAGKVSVETQDAVTLTDGSTIFNTVQAGAIGNAQGVIIQANSFSLLEGAEIQAGNKGGRGDAGNVTVEVGDRILFDGLFSDGFASGIFAGVIPEGIGEAGDIRITANALTISDGARLQTKSEGLGDSGDVIIDVEGEIFFDGSEKNPQPEFEHLTGIFTTLETKNFQRGGDVRIETGSLKIINGAEITANTFGLGDVGNITIEARDSITLDGVNERTGISGIFTVVGRDANGAVGKGQGGNIEIITNSLSLNNGAKIAAATQGEGDAGKVDIIATDRVLLDGMNSEIITSVTAEAIGNGSDIEITTDRLTISNEARLNSTAFAEGDAGNIEINAQDITLDKGRLTAETRVGTQGNISLNNADTLLLRNNSQITTNASESATGGDISIESSGIALLDNSDITANAVQGQGGNIQITTQGIFQEPDSQITAASELGIDGTVTFNTPDVDPASGIFELPDVPIDAAGILAQDLCKLEDDKIAKGSSFIITGRGGLTPTSEGSLENRDRIVNWASRDDLEVSSNGLVGVRQRPASNTSAAKKHPVIQQSQGLVATSDGSLWLVANTPETTPQNSGIDHPDCRTLQEER